ncbi:hypothetical protein DFH09DRAFT_1306492 [Mycena vulgaris]|nr:hypothetical protein DFH09DRAFT_1306492 [Mycena vulgaris]
MPYHIIIIPPGPILDAESVPELWLCATAIIIHLPIPRPAYNLLPTGPTTFVLTQLVTALKGHQSPGTDSGLIQPVYLTAEDSFPLNIALTVYFLAPYFDTLPLS